MADFDIAIIGGGTAGYSAALRAAENNLKVALIEKDKLGGTCLHKGCIPTKSLIEAADTYSLTKRAGDFGINISETSIQWPQVQKYKSKVVEDLYNGLKSLVNARKIELIDGYASFVSEDTIQVNGRQIKADNFILAVGGRPRTLDMFPESERVLNSDQILNLQTLPDSLIVIGGGYIGIEFGSLFQRLGTEVTIIEVAPQVLAGNDVEMCTMLSDELRQQGIKIQTGTQMDKVEATDTHVEVSIGNNGPSYKAQYLLVAIGRQTNTDGLGLENTKVTLDQKGFINVDDNLRAAGGNIYAIGDCINTPQLAHVSFAEGIAVADFIAKGEANYPNYNAVPSAIYSHPQLAAVGVTEQQAKTDGNSIKKAYFNFGANSKAVISQEKEGMAKIISDENDNILGIHILGADAANLISEAMLAVGWEAKVSDVANLIHPHPTFSEVIGEAAMKLTGKPLHSL